MRHTDESRCGVFCRDIFQKPAKPYFFAKISFRKVCISAQDFLPASAGDGRLTEHRDQLGNRAIAVPDGPECERIVHGYTGQVMPVPP